MTTHVLELDRGGRVSIDVGADPSVTITAGDGDRFMTLPMPGPDLIELLHSIAVMGTGLTRCHGPAVTVVFDWVGNTADYSITLHIRIEHGRDVLPPMVLTLDDRAQLGVTVDRLRAAVGA